MSVVIDRDAVSPDSIRAANEYLTGTIEITAETLAVALDWNTFRTYAPRKRNGDLEIVQSARIVR